ncbi:MAG: hypothetical protein CMC97_06415, partial [Flavobacteriales bacterium]|nr:hypothetical protein [Flavobacteriales bacterium]
VSPVFSIRRLDFHDLDPARGALRGELTLHFDSDLPAVEIVEAGQVVSLTGSNTTVAVTANATTLTLRIPGEEGTISTGDVDAFVPPKPLTVDFVDMDLRLGILSGVLTVTTDAATPALVRVFRLPAGSSNMTVPSELGSPMLTAVASEVTGIPVGPLAFDVNTSVIAVDTFGGFASWPKLIVPLDDLSITYSVSDTDPDQGKYEGTLVLIAVPARPRIFEIYWRSKTTSWVHFTAIPHTVRADITISTSADPLFVGKEQVNSRTML